jgi:hypothetical protein
MPTAASAQVGGTDLRLGLGAVLDFGGHTQADFGPGRGPDDHLRLTPGLRAHIDYDIHRNVSLGGLARVSWWEGDDYYNNGRNFLFDLGFRVNGHYDWRDFRFYGALTIGPTISALNRDNRTADANPGFGVNASITPGAEWWFSRRAGLFLEMFGWSGHFFHHDFDTGVNDSRVRFRNNQVLWQLGFVIAL